MRMTGNKSVYKKQLKLQHPFFKSAEYLESSINECDYDAFIQRINENNIELTDKKYEKLKTMIDRRESELKSLGDSLYAESQQQTLSAIRSFLEKKQDEKITGAINGNTKKTR